MKNVWDVCIRDLLPCLQNKKYIIVFHLRSKISEALSLISFVLTSMALLSSLASYFAGVIRSAKMTFSKLPPNSLFKSFFRFWIQFIISRLTIINPVLNRWFMISTIPRWCFLYKEEKILITLPNMDLYIFMMSCLCALVRCPRTLTIAFSSVPIGQSYKNMSFTTLM